MTTLTFTLDDGEPVTVPVTRLFNAGYAGRNREQTAAHIAELAALGVPAPAVTPTLYPIGSYLASQADTVPVQHARTSGEAEWALVVTGPHPEQCLLTVASDHTDRALEQHGVAWSKHACPDVLGRRAWRLTDVEDRLDTLRLRAWVRHATSPATLVQDATLDALLPPAHWRAVLRERGWHTAGTVLLSGTVTLLPGVDPFADTWHVELGDPHRGDTLCLDYTVAQLAPPIA